MTNENKVNQGIGLRLYFALKGATIDQEYYSTAAIYRGELLNEFCLIEYFIDDSVSSYYYFREVNIKKHNKLFHTLTSKVKSFDTKIEIYKDTLLDEYPQIEAIIYSLRKEKFLKYMNKSLFDIRNVMAHWNILGRAQQLINFEQNGEIHFVQRHLPQDDGNLFKGISLTFSDLNEIKDKLINIKNEIEIVDNLIRQKVGLPPANTE